MQLSKTNLAHINSGAVALPPAALLDLPEKVLQFGTGVLLRGLPDYFIDKANRAGRFNGRVVVVKSTEAGDATAFAAQDGLYTLCIRGVEAGSTVEETLVCSAISRVLSAKNQWDEILRCAQNPQLKIIISNTTEVGIQLMQESIFQQPPSSFPAKLLSFLYERFKMLGAGKAPGLVVLPTELLSDNGKKLKSIVDELAAFNKLEEAFINWMQANVTFCNTLVDCIVPGKPDVVLQTELETTLGHKDDLLIVSEVYRLWAIEGDEKIKAICAFAETDARVVITPDITKYKELKLRLLNGTHTLSCGLAHLAGFATVREAMESPVFSAFISGLMLNELAPAIPLPLPKEEAVSFGMQVLDRFRNPYLQHRWLSITMQYSSKMAQRTIPVLLHYYRLYKKVPQRFALGVAAYLLFMKAVKQEGATFFGECNGVSYLINDDQASFYFRLWQNNNGETVVHAALRNEKQWGADLSRLDGFEAAVNRNLHELQTLGAMHAVSQWAPDMGF